MPDAHESTDKLTWKLEPAIKHTSGFCFYGVVKIGALWTWSIHRVLRPGPHFDGSPCDRMLTAIACSLHVGLSIKRVRY